MLDESSSDESDEARAAEVWAASVGMSQEAMERAREWHRVLMGKNV